MTAIVHHDHDVAPVRADERSLPFSGRHFPYVVDGEFFVVPEQTESGDQTQTVRPVPDEQFEFFVSGISAVKTKKTFIFEFI